MEQMMSRDLIIGELKNLILDFMAFLKSPEYSVGQVISSYEKITCFLSAQDENIWSELPDDDTDVDPEISSDTHQKYNVEAQSAIFSRFPLLSFIDHDLGELYIILKEILFYIDYFKSSPCKNSYLCISAHIKHILKCRIEMIRDNAVEKNVNLSQTFKRIS